MAGSTVSTKPKSKLAETVSFVNAGGEKDTVSAPAEKEPGPILLRGIDGDLMKRLDKEAKRRRLNRSATIRTLLAEVLPDEE